MYSEILVLIHIPLRDVLAMTSSVTLPELQQNYALAHMGLPQNRFMCGKLRHQVVRCRPLYG
jgi:hypothetical protein